VEASEWRTGKSERGVMRASMRICRKRRNRKGASVAQKCISRNVPRRFPPATVCGFELVGFPLASGEKSRWARVSGITFTCRRALGRQLARGMRRWLVEIRFTKWYVITDKKPWENPPHSVILFLFKPNNQCASNHAKNQRPDPTIASDASGK